MQNEKRIGNTFVVTTIEDAVSVQVQYAPTASPSSSQIHNIWQSGDDFMRTRPTSEDLWSPWFRIVGEKGDETDYSFNTSDLATGVNGDTSYPAHLGYEEWQDAPVAPTAAKPFLWSKVVKRHYVDGAPIIDSTDYIRLTGEKGNDAPDYRIESSVGNVTIPQGESSANIQTYLSFYKNGAEFACHCTVFKKKGYTYTAIRTVPSAAHTTITINEVNADDYDAIVVCIYAAASISHSDYLKELVIPVLKNGDNGTSAPYYTNESYAWSNDTTTVNVNTAPTLPQGHSWADHIEDPYATYLWRKVVRYTLVEGTTDYTAGTPQYYRASGLNGTSIRTKGSVDYEDSSQGSGTALDLIVNPSDGDAYVVGVDTEGNINWLYQYLEETGNWQSLGQFKGEPGKTYYTHIVWAEDVIFNSRAVSQIIGYSPNRTPNDTTHFWMGTKVDENPMDAQTAAEAIAAGYEWGYTKGADGTSPIFADLDNEMDSLACDKNGYVAGSTEKTITTTVSFYKGTTKQTQAFSAITVSVEGVTLSSDYVSEATVRMYCKATANLLTGEVTITVKSGTPINDKAAAVINASMVIEGTTEQRALMLTVAGVRAGADGKDAVVYNILPSVSAVNFIRNASGSFIDSMLPLSLSVKKSVGGTVTTQTIAQSGLTFRYGFTTMPATKDDGTAWGTGDGTAGSTWSGQTLYVLSSASFANVYVAAFKSDGTLVDRETIPIMKGGAKGNDATVYEIECQPETVSIPSVADTATLSATISFFKTVGASRSAASVYYLYRIRKVDGTYRGMVLGGATTSVNINSLTLTRDDEAIEVYINITNSTSSYVAKKEIYITKAGKRGRWHYYAGEWDNLSDVVEFPVSDTQAPFFLYGGTAAQPNFWAWVGGNPSDGTYTKAEMGTPSSGGTGANNWELFWNDQKYYIMEAVFGSFAKFGSCIISGDWMISGHGTIGGEASNDYQLFDEEHPFSSNGEGEGGVGTNFIPKYAVNLRDGQIYGVEFQTAVANGMYAKMSATAIGMYNALTGNPCVMFGVDSDGSPYIDMYNKDGIIAWRWDYRGFKSWIGDVIPRSWGELILAPIERGDSYTYLYRAANNRNDPVYGWKSWYRFSGQGTIENGVFVLALGNDTTYNEKITSDSSKPTLNPNDIPNVFGDDKMIPDGYYLLWKYDHGIDSVSINGKTLHYLTYVRVADGKITGEYLIHYLVGPSGATPYKADGSGPLDDDIGEHPWD